MASDFNEVERFDEYNPHPYQGGYDIALTYGQPLPPSSAICYPISPSPSSPPPSEPPSITATAGPRDEPEREAPRLGGEPALGGEDWDGGSGYGVDGCRGSEDGVLPGEAMAYPDVFGYWPFPAQEFHGSRGGRGSGEWDILNCAADYLFAYLRPYGEKRHESHNYGNLNYAYERHHREEPLLVQFSPHEPEPSWCGKPSYYEDYWEEGYRNSGYAFRYGRDSSEAPDSETLCVESSWSPSSYHEGYSGKVYPQSEPQSECSYAYESCPSSYHEAYSREVYPQSDCSYAYERCYYEQPLAVQHEQVERHTWSQRPTFSESYESHVHTQRADVHTSGSKFYGQPMDMFDFIEKSWHQILDNNASGEANSYPQFKLHDDSWNKNEVQSYIPFWSYSDYDD